MAKNRFAQLQYGKVIYIYETDLKKSQLSTIFEPDTFWVDVTGQKCEEGWIAEFKEGVGVVFSKPPNLVLTLEEEKDAKIAEFKKLRDERGVAKLTYKDVTFDYDDASREKMRERRQYLEDNNIEYVKWTTANNSEAILTVEDFKAINSLAAERRNELHNRYNILKNLVREATNINDVREISFDKDISIYT